MAKVVPLYDVLNSKVKQLGILHDHVSIDESMGDMDANNSSKTNRYDLGTYDVRIYEGKGSTEPGTPLGVQMVNNAIETCAIPNGTHAFFDNVFSSVDLINDLKKREINATATLRDDRLKGCPVRSKAEISKMKRGTIDFCSTKIVFSPTGMITP